MAANASDPSPVAHDAARFDKPPGFDDLTDYLFESADGARLAVRQGPPSPSKRPDPEVAVAAYLTQLHRLFPPAELMIRRVGPDRAASFAAQRLDFAFTDRSQQWREQSVFARLPDGSDLHMAYVTPEETAGADDRFDWPCRAARCAESRGSHGRWLTLLEGLSRIRGISW
jgi:hypothetical protein